MAWNLHCSKSQTPVQSCWSSFSREANMETWKTFCWTVPAIGFPPWALNVGIIRTCLVNSWNDGTSKNSVFSWKITCKNKRETAPWGEMRYHRWFHGKSLGTCYTWGWESDYPLHFRPLGCKCCWWDVGSLWTPGKHGKLGFPRSCHGLAPSRSTEKAAQMQKPFLHQKEALDDEITALEAGQRGRRLMWGPSPYCLGSSLAGGNFPPLGHCASLFMDTESLPMRTKRIFRFLLPRADDHTGL